MDLTPIEPSLNLVLVEPQIPPNTGNVARLCAVTGCRLHLVGPLGFSVDEKDLRRAGLDYWDQVVARAWTDFAEFLAGVGSARLHLFTARRGRPLWEVTFAPGDYLVFGSEPRGLPREVVARHPERAVRIPMLPGRRSINLSTSVGIAAYEAIRQIHLAPPAGGRRDV